MREWRRATVAVAFVTGCGSNVTLPPYDLSDPGSGDAGSRVEPGSPDASPPSDGAEASPGADAESGADAADSGSDATLSAADAGVDAAPAPGLDAGTLVLAGVRYFPILITSDALVVYGAFPANQAGIYAVPLAGGAEIAVDTVGPSYVVEGFGPNVLTWDVTSFSAATGKLSIWSRSGAAVLAASSLTRSGSLSGNADGSEISFSQNATGTQFDLALLSGDAGARVLLSGIQTGSCAASSGFLGSTLVVQHCDTPLPDGGAPNSQPPTLSAFDDGGVRRDLATLTPDPPAVGSAWSSASGAPLVYASVDGPSPTAQVIALATGTKTVIDPEGEEGFLVPDGSAVVYRSKDKLRRSATASASPVDLAATGSVGGLSGLSADGTVVAYFTQSATTGGYIFTDVAVSTTDATGSVAHQVVATPTANFSGFTPSASHVLYWSSPNASTGLATLSGAPTGGGPARMLATNVLAWEGVTGSKVVLADNCTAAGLCDVHAADLATGAAPVLVAASVNANATGAFVLTTDGSTLIYGSNGLNNVTAGIYAVPAP